MINPLKTGAYIARLRKKRDWTQVELADKLHVTHQAVSRWETGESFPDLGTLAQLAQLFGVRMDSLIDGGQTLFSGETVRNKVLSELAEGHAEQVARLVNENPADFDTVIESGPLTRPSLIKLVVEKLDSYPFSLEQITGLAPFVSQETLDGMVAGLTVEASEAVDSHFLVGLAPFLGPAQLNRLASLLAEHVDGGKLDKNHLVALAPFLDQEALDWLVQQVPQGEIESYQLPALAPFLSPPVLDKLVEGLAQDDLDLDQLTALAPFLDQEALDRRIASLPLSGLDIEQVTGLAPFVGRPALDKLVESLAAQALDGEQVVGLAPFVDPQTLGRLIALVPEGAIDAHAIVALAPFLDREALEALIRGQKK